MDLDEFVNATKPTDRRSPAMPFRADILTLRGLGYRLQQICEYLELNGVKLSESALSSFIARTSARQAGKRPNSPPSLPVRSQTASTELSDVVMSGSQSKPIQTLTVRDKPIDVMKHAGRHVDLDHYSRIAREKFKQEKLKGEKK